jgi:hypothetical protein
MPSDRGGRGPPPPGVMPNGLLPPLRGGRLPEPAGRPSPRASPRGAEERPSPLVPSMRGPTGRPSRPPNPGGPGRALGPPGMKLGFGLPSGADGLPSRCACAARAASCSALSAAARASAAATSMSWALAGLATGVGGTIDMGAFGFTPDGAAGFLGGAGLADTLGSLTGAGAGAGPFGALGVEGLGPAANASLSRRATGASTVLDADLTNSPISLSLARTFLLSTPSSFASSCTRALPATALLISRSHGQVPAATSLVHLKPDHFSDFIVCSCRSFLCSFGATTAPPTVFAGISRPGRVTLDRREERRPSRLARRCQEHPAPATRARRLGVAARSRDSPEPGVDEHHGQAAHGSDRAGG